MKQGKRELLNLYMEQDPVFAEDPDKPPSEYVCQLLKALYGTKQGARLWQDLVQDFVTKDGWTMSRHSDCVCFGMKADAPYDAQREHLRGLRVMTYITDDFAISHTDDKQGRENYRKYFERFNARFPSTNLGDLKWYCNMAVHRGADNVYQISHKAYIEAMITKQEMDDVAGQNLPYNERDIKMLNEHSYTDTAPELGKQIPVKRYRSKIGAIQYAAQISTPGAAATAGVLAGYMQEGIPREAHERAADHVIGYLKRHKNDVMRMNPGDMKVRAGCDTDYATCKRTRRSRGGVYVRVGNAIVMYQSSMQSTVATSPAEAEFREVANAVKRVKWARYAMEEYGYSQEEPTEIECDCDPAIKIMENSGSGSSMRHVDVDYRFAQEAAKRNIVKIVPVDTSRQAADILTKSSLTSKQFHELNDTFIQRKKQNSVTFDDEVT